MDKVTHKSLKVLLFEGNSEDSCLLKELLIETDTTPLELIFVRLLEEGLKHLTAESFDVVLVDLSDRCSLEVVTRIRTVASSVPIVLLISSDNQGLADQAKRADVEAYLFIDGYEVARRLRQEPGLSKVVLIALTIYKEELIQPRFQEAGCDAYFVKPIDLPALQKILHLQAAKIDSSTS